MNHSGGMSRRALVRIVSFLTALVVVLGVSAFCGWKRANTYERSMEYAWQRAVEDLSRSVSDIDVALIKGMYAGTSGQFEDVALLLSSSSDTAKNCLSQLPTSELNLETTTKFISQVGDFAHSLARKVKSGGTISDDERESMVQLSDYAKQLSAALDGMSQQLLAGVIRVGDTRNAMQLLGKSESPSVNDGFLEIEDSFTEYPSLIYDGPFSDHIMQKRPLALQGLPNRPEADCKSAAAQFVGVDPQSLSSAGETGGTIESFDFSGENRYVNVTKAGGIVSYFLNSREIGEQTLSGEQAVERAKAFLCERDLDSMGETYYYISDGICTINFAFEQDGVRCYSDLMKVGVALDNGEVVLYDARGYLMNHTARPPQTPAISPEKARESLSGLLEVQSVSLAYTPVTGTSDVLCYEFRCIGQNDEEILVYVNAMTGAEEQILILLRTDEGILAI